MKKKGRKGEWGEGEKSERAFYGTRRVGEWKNGYNNSSKKNEPSITGNAMAAKAILPTTKDFILKIPSLKPRHNKYVVTGIFSKIPEITPGANF
jgi:hypothetical protein